MSGALAAAALCTVLAAEPGPDARRVQLSLGMAWHLGTIQLEAAWLGFSPWRLAAGVEGIGLIGSRYRLTIAGHAAAGQAWTLLDRPVLERALRARLVVEGGARAVYERLDTPFTPEPPGREYTALHVGLLSTTGLELSWRWPWLDVVMGLKAALTLLPGAAPALLFPNVVPAPPQMWPHWARSPALTTPLGVAVFDVRASAGAAF